MQFSEIQTIVNDHLEASQFDNWTAALTKRWINRAVRWACDGQVITGGGLLISHDFSFLTNEVQASTVDQQRKYDLPDGTVATVWKFRKDKNVELVDASNYRKPLTKLHKTDIEDEPEFAYLLDKGVPSHFCIEQSKLWLFPLPYHAANSGTAFTINMEYFGYLPELSADADTNIFTTDFPELLEWKATGYGFEWAKDADQLGYYDNRAKERLLEMITNDQGIDLGGIERGMRPTAGTQLGV